MIFLYVCFFFFFNDTATTEIYTLSLHDALPISTRCGPMWSSRVPPIANEAPLPRRDRKSTRLNSSHVEISYADFCLKKKTQFTNSPIHQFTNSSIQQYINSTIHLFITLFII